LEFGLLAYAREQLGRPMLAKEFNAWRSPPAAR
jgi:hypothetical protein